MGSTSQTLPKQETVTIEEIQVVPKSREEMIREWFRDHPEDLEKTGRELENILLDGVKITYKTWNTIKKKVVEEFGK